MYRYKLAGQNDKPVYELLYEYIRNDILTGKLVSGDRLPSKRNMASDNGISVTTVVNAYNQLLMEGYIKSFEKKGYFVSDISALPKVKKKNLYENPLYVEDNWFADFGSNNILYKNFPHFTWKKVVREVLSTYETELIMRGHPFGNEELKSEIADYLYRNRGITVSPELIVVGAGIEFLYNRLINVLPSSSTYAVENPGYKKIPKLYNSFSLNWKSIDMDDEGINMRDLETVNPNIVHVSPEHHYPLGTFMPLKRRQELLAWGCGAANRYIIEDDFDCEFRYGSKPMPALKSLDVCECIKNINLAKDFFDGYSSFDCESWLLSPNILSLLPKESNIRKFQKLFDVKNINYGFAQASERVLNEAYTRGQNSSLYLKLKDYVKENGDPGIGYGVYKKF